MHHLFIVNPTAGKGRAVGLIPEIENIMRKHELIFQLEKTNYPGQATEIARQYILNKAEYLGGNHIKQSPAGEEAACHRYSYEKNMKLRIYAVGGDGTVNEVVNAIAGTDTELVILPSGSGNDYIRSLTNMHDPLEILEASLLLDGVRQDIGRINGRYFVNICSSGFDAEVVKCADHFKRIPFFPGTLSYIMGIVLPMLRLDTYDVKVVLDNTKEFRNTYLLMVFANGKYYGGGMMPVPKASMEDGILDICLIEPVTRIQIIPFFQLFRKGNHGKLNQVSFHRCRHISIESMDKLPVNIDGEVTMLEKITCEIVERGLNVVIPK